MSSPVKGTPEWDLWVSAIEVVIHAPWDKNEFAYAAKIPWGDIHELRKALEKVGVDWRTAKVAEDARRKEAAVRLQDKREAEQRERNAQAERGRQ